MGVSMETFTAFYIFGLCGLAGVLLDIDHLVAMVIWRYFNPRCINGRLFHKPVFIATGLTIIGMGAYLTRLYFKLVLGW